MSVDSWVDIRLPRPWWLLLLTASGCSAGGRDFRDVGSGGAAGNGKGGRGTEIGGREPSNGGAAAAGGSSGFASGAGTLEVVCGDGVSEAQEACDHGTLNSNSVPDACRIDCSLPRCGDNVIDSTEECDGNDPSCTVDCKSVRCGNQRTEEGEDCDPPDGQSCASNCRAIRCGNGRMEAEEQCDPPKSGSCSAQCKTITCGDGTQQEGEECEPPNTTTCSAQCKTIVCGNGRTDQGEGCDPPNTATCDAQCRTIGCGNARMDPGEECEPPNSATCDNACRSIRCGNGRVDPGEACDEVNPAQCNANCQKVKCGDGRLDAGEACEPKSASDPDCTADCTRKTPMPTGMPQVLFSFDSSIDPWTLYATSPERLKANTKLSYDSQNGDATPGALKVEAPFDASNQKVEFQATLAAARDLSGRTLRARVRVASGLSSDSAHPGAIKFFAKAGANYDYASGAWAELKPGSSWADVTFQADAPVLIPGTFSPKDVRQVGFELRVFSETTQVSAAVVYVDSISVQ